MLVTAKPVFICLILTATLFSTACGKKTGTGSGSVGSSGSGSYGSSGSSSRPNSNSFGSSQSLGGGTGSNYRPYAPFVGGRYRNQRARQYRGDKYVCPSQFNCSTGDVANGIKVCRTQHSPISGDPYRHAACIDDSLSWTSDNCGCCGNDCFEDLSFQELECTDENNITVAAAQRDGVTDSFGLETICRDIFNPFTGEPMMPGDICGCCDGECPVSLGEQLKNNDFFEPITCSDEKTIECDLPFDDGSGIFVCREHFSAFTGLSDTAAVCIPPSHSWATDECGCCGGECPDPPVAASAICDDVEDIACELNSGDTGTFVCRSLFHPIDGQVRYRSLCVVDTFVSDSCGCCDWECPETPENGFEDEFSQLLMLALEDPQDLEAADFNLASSAVGNPGRNVLSGLFLLASTIGTTLLALAY
eukprot:CAMPEP_0117005828 /NCGR_PEP_ID=MMETSP0472-20121206/6283_1 /TAXON_ID=693140 ORGANISM="Tiarina fusus, Strain LIS" /NCGR_SAMPLE_ID=MMETSP0472 /ASSEMBLY_ACC=CAM_ASM_000603 /LENGTH=418 /DNA_ID=CAMNT_0004707137 /DNA_START=87 /DNA_END=1343 /DNA_ORIENTATION=-